MVTELEQLKQAKVRDQIWAERHYWQNFEKVVQALNALPSGQAHALRQTMFTGRQATEAYLDLIRERYQASDASDQSNGKLEDLLPLFYPEGETTGLFLTRFLDALESQDFFPKPNSR